MTGTLLKLGIQKFFGEVPFLILGEIGYIYIYIGPTQSWPKYFCVTSVSHVKEMTYLVEFLRTRIMVRSWGLILDCYANLAPFLAYFVHCSTSVLNA